MAELLRADPCDRLVFEVTTGTVAKSTLQLSCLHTGNVAYKVQNHLDQNYGRRLVPRQP